MVDDIQIIIDSAKKRAVEIIRATKKVRDAYSDGRPNSSQESTVDGTLRAFKALIADFDPLPEE